MPTRRTQQTAAHIRLCHFSSCSLYAFSQPANVLFDCVKIHIPCIAFALHMRLNMTRFVCMRIYNHISTILSAQLTATNLCDFIVRPMFNMNKVKLLEASYMTNA